LMRWNRLRYENGMSHVVSDDLLLVIRDDMDRATPPGMLERAMIVDAICLELGGPCDTRRPYEEVAFYDLAIRIPSEDLQPLLVKWRDASMATSLGQDFYRLTSWPWQCLVVTPWQRAELLAIFNGCAAQAERRAEEFWTDRKSPQEILRAHNESRGLFITYGSDKIARFRS
jgi:hypothetical protein